MDEQITIHPAFITFHYCKRSCVLHASHVGESWRSSICHSFIAYYALSQALISELQENLRELNLDSGRKLSGVGLFDTLSLLVVKQLDHVGYGTLKHPR